MFQFAGFPSARYGFTRGCAGLPRAGFPIQRPADRRTCAPPLPGFFSPFLHSTLLYRSLSSIQPCGVVPASSAWVSRVPAYSGSRCAASCSGYGALALSGRLFQSRSPALRGRLCGPNPAAHAPRFGLLRFRSPLLPESMFLSLPPAT